MVAHDTTTGALLWRNEMSGNVWSLCIHGGVVVVPVEDENIVVLDVSTGHQQHVLPSAGRLVYGVCVFEGLSGARVCLGVLLTPCYCSSAVSKVSLEVGGNIGCQRLGK